MKPPNLMMLLKTIGKYNMLFNLKFKKAFTLAEILITLAIIGVISVMVIPIFTNSYNSKVLGTQLKKVCTQITLAARNIIADEHAQDVIEKDEIFEQDEEPDENEDGTTTEDGTTEEGDDQSTEQNTVQGGFYLSSAGAKTSSSSSGAEYFLNKYFTHLKVNCGPDGSGSCVASQYTSPNNTNLGTIPSGFYCIRTTNSATICMKYEDSVTKVIVDVNGTNGPNTAGFDTFVMYITNDGDLKDLDDNTEHCNKSGSTIIQNAAGCFAKIVNNGWVMPKN